MPEPNEQVSELEQLDGETQSVDGTEEPSSDLEPKNLLMNRPINPHEP